MTRLSIQAIAPRLKETKAIPQTASIVAISVGILVLIGWGLNVPLFKSGLPDLPTMKVNTAVGFILAGVSLWLNVGERAEGRRGRESEEGERAERSERKNRFYRAMGQGCALAVLSIGLLTLSQYLLGWNLGIDKLLVRGAPEEVYPGRMGGTTAINFILSGAALWLIGQKNHHRHDIAQVLTLAIALFSLLALMGYVYGVEAFYTGIVRGTRVALHTSLTFLVLSVGILLDRADRGFMAILTSNLHGGLVIRHLLPGAIAVPLILGWLKLQGEQAGYYNSAFGTSLLVVSIVIFYLSLIWRNAIFLNRLDRDRQQSEERFRQMAETIQDVCWISKPQHGQLLYVSPAYETIWGRSCESLYANYYGWLEAIHPEDRERIEQILSKQILTGRYDEEYRVVRPDGSIRWVRDRGFPTWGDRGELLYAVGIAEDITERHLTSEVQRRLVECAKLKGYEFFACLVRLLAETLDARYAFVAEVSQEMGRWGDGEMGRKESYPPLLAGEGLGAAVSLPNGERSRSKTIAVWVNGEWQENFEYALAGTPCQEVISQGVCFYPEGTAELFPDDRLLAEMGIDSYLGTPLRAADGTVLGLLVVMSDRPLALQLQAENLIQMVAGQAAAEMERLQTETSLRQSEERLRMALENSPVTLFAQDRDLRYTWVYNPQQNFSLNETIGKRDADLLPPEDADLLTAIKRQVLETGIGTRQEVEIAIGGQQTYYDLLVEPWRARTGEVIGITCAAIDMTARQHSEMALQESEERLRVALEAAHMGTWRWHIPTNLETRDAKLNQLFGLETRPSIQSGKDFVFHVHPEDRPDTIAAFERSLQDRSPFALEYRIVCPDGTVRWLLDKGTVLCDSENRPLYMTGACLDITDRKRSEQEREQLLVREQRARSAAESVNRLKDEFLAVLSHELRSPLNPIQAWAQILQTRQLPAEKVKQGLEIIERNAKLQTQLVDDLLDVSRILRGQMALEATPVNLIEVITGAISSVRLAAEAKSIDLRLSVPDLRSAAGRNPRYIVAGDAARLQQIVWNLLSNAVKFTPNGGRVDICLKRVEGEQGNLNSEFRIPNSELQTACARITVSDTGLGISPEFLPYVFDCFRQADGSNSRKFGGLGLGLAIVRHLIELHGGTIQAQSPGEGLGATFTVNLPLMANGSTNVESDF
ncbi:MAG: PAS domain-containing protein [Cyanosarcina radialis HA8281-LM2]|jgi:PAS domain S-box-containing protein|nr:PAS domain-containing protein [Cyanosarcina radialis HA8281-LM2]